MNLPTYFLNITKYIAHVCLLAVIVSSVTILWHRINLIECLQQVDLYDAEFHSAWCRLDAVELTGVATG